jgi:tetratricopeptide (TPR) repeat protein
MYFRIGEHDKAMQDAQKTLEMNPSDAFAYLLLADIHSSNGNIIAFYTTLQKAVELDPSQIHQLDATTRARHEHEERFQTLLKNAPPKDSDKKKDKPSPPSPLGS